MFLHVPVAKKHNCQAQDWKNTFFQNGDCECALVPFENEVIDCYIFTDVK